MTNNEILVKISQQLEDAAERIGKLAMSIDQLAEATPEICEDFEHFLLDEVTHVQILALEMTKMVTGEEEHQDESAFAEGELTSVLGDKTEDEEMPKEEEK